MRIRSWLAPGDPCVSIRSQIYTTTNISVRACDAENLPTFHFHPINNTPMESPLQILPLQLTLVAIRFFICTYATNNYFHATTCTTVSAMFGVYVTLRMRHQRSFPCKQSLTCPCGFHSWERDWQQHGGHTNAPGIQTDVWSRGLPARPPVWVTRQAVRCHVHQPCPETKCVCCSSHGLWQVWMFRHGYPFVE